MPTAPYNEKKCPVCGKIFVCYFTSAWTYKMTHLNATYVMCSWTCYTKFKADHYAMLKRRGRKKKIDLREVQEAD